MHDKAKNSGITYNQKAYAVDSMHLYSVACLKCHQESLHSHSDLTSYTK